MGAISEALTLRAGALEVDLSPAIGGSVGATFPMPVAGRADIGALRCASGRIFRRMRDAGRLAGKRLPQPL